jgi:signal peptidase I
MGRRLAGGAPPRRPRTFPGAAAAMVAVLLALRLWVLVPMTVVSDSMAPAVPLDGTVLTFTLGPALGGVHAGRLVVFDGPEDGGPVLKRVAATGGQSVAIRDAVLLVDGVPVSEPGVDRSRIDGTYFGPVTVPAGHVFVLGDNRAASIDSRDYGSVDVSRIRATVLLPRL